jgi:hypothetical protein
VESSAEPWILHEWAANRKQSTAPPSTLSHRPHGLRWYYADIEEEEADSQYLKALPWWR